MTHHQHDPHLVLFNSCTCDLNTHRYIRVLEGGQIDAAKPVKEGLSPEAVAALIAACSETDDAGAQPGDLLLIAAGPKATVAKAMDRVRALVPLDR